MSESKPAADAFPIGCRVKPTSAYYQSFRVSLRKPWPRGTVVGYGRKSADAVRVLIDGRKSAATYPARFWQRI